ncbi:hypothetical protein [Olleya sp. YS]|uniref:hypothetical protein n=1 Tax=Olleya sp. YS TaxID=3028318 RepID=UPI00243449EB|nr:hypothetical protein [Olleya sp. YS]WGD35568.1 hypothetical protein Ollyesu_03970 [Olleya sp. YS]
MIQLTSIIIMTVQIAALVAAILSWKKYSNSTQKYFLFFLIYIVLNEIAGYVIGGNNLYLYNIYTVLSISFYLFWFHQILDNKWIIKVFGLVFLSTIMYSAIKLDFWTNLWVLPFIPSSIIIIICSTMFFNSFLNHKSAINYINSQKFWIVAGLLIFYIGFLPIALTWDLIDKGSVPFRLIIMTLNLLLYGFYIKSFLCLKQN